MTATDDKLSSTRLLLTHPAVADALVTMNADGPTAWIVPDEHVAPMLHRSAVIEDAGRLGPLSWHEPADGLRIAGLNHGETAFLYREIFTDHAYLPAEMALPRDAIIVDIGANIGMFIVRAALHSPGARFVAVEPAVELAEAVRINAELHGIDATVVCAAAGATESETDYTFYRRNTVMSGRFADAEQDFAVLKGYLLTGENPAVGERLDRLATESLVGESRLVPGTTVTKICERYALDRIDLLKVDVEKAEAEVLAGISDELWPRIQRLVLEVHDLDSRLAAVLELLRSRGYSVRTDQDPRLALTPCHMVYAHRAGAASADPVPATPGGRGPTLRELERDLRRLFAEQHPPAEPPRRFAVVADLARAEDRDAGSAGARQPGSSPRVAALATAWAALFGADAVRPGMDFFELGGDSMTALRLLDRIEKELGECPLSPELIFAEGTFGALAAAIEASPALPQPGGAR